MITNFQSPNLQREIIRKQYNNFFLNFHQLIYLSSSISRPSLKFLAVIIFEISYLQNCTLSPSKGHNSARGDNSDKRKNTGKLFFDEESIYEISKP